MRPITTGYPSIDAALGGLITGDNVVWLCDDEHVYRLLASEFVATATRSVGHCLYVDFGGGLFVGAAQVDRLDARPGGEFERPSPLADALERRVLHDSPECLVVDRLGYVSRRWRDGDPMRFFARVCPAMLQSGVTAYWHVDDVFGRPFVEDVRQITQCLLDVRRGRLRVLKAEGRPDALQGITYRLRVHDQTIEATAAAAGGRLARGLTAIRHQLGLSQQELAAIANVTPGAISQAEAGNRGLSLDTVVAIADGLDISVDRVLGSSIQRTYRLARHDRSRRLPNSSVIALTADATVGLRVYLIELEGHVAEAPPFQPRDVSTLAVLRGLVQVDLADDRPVLRAGDALVIERGAISTWRNLRHDRASCFWIVRD